MGEVEFRRNKDTGIIESWKDGKYIGSIISMDDQIVGIVQKVPSFIKTSSNKELSKAYKR